MVTGIYLDQTANDLHMPLPVLALLKSSMVLSFWSQLTQYALEKRPLN